jgi:hypothetical protein
MTSEIPSFQKADLDDDNYKYPDEVQEGIKVTIEEEKEESEDEIKELVYTLKTFSSNDASALTEKINGKLLAMIITADKATWLNISSADNGFTVYEKKDYNGTYYLPVRITPVSKSGNQFNFSAEYFFLNEALVIQIRGQIDTTATIKIRYCEE